MAPEVILSAANHEAYDSLVDSYSIGVVVFCMCVRFFLLYLHLHTSIVLTPVLCDRVAVFAIHLINDHSLYFPSTGWLRIIPFVI